MDQVIGKMLPEEYYRFALKMEELQHEQSKVKIKEQQASLLEKDLELLKLKVVIQKQVTLEGRMLLNQVKKEYEVLRDELGVKLGIELKDMVIDPITFEIKKISP